MLFDLSSVSPLYFFPSVGGSVKGAQVLGQYPDDISNEGPLILQRGKFSMFIVKINSCF